MRYLLGNLSEDEKTRLEEAFFADDAKFEELEIAEEELIDAYVRNALSPKEQEQFKAKLLRSPRLLERVHFARILAEKADSTLLPEIEDSIESDSLIIPIGTKPKPKWWEGLLARPTAGLQAAFAACLIFLIGGGVLFYGWLQLRSESEQLANERAALQRQKDEFDRLSAAERAKIEQQAADLQRKLDQVADSQRPSKGSDLLQKPKELDRAVLGSIFSLVLTPGSLRSGGTVNEVKIGHNTSHVELRLPLETSDYRRYSVIIENVDDGRTILKPNLRPQNTNSGQQLIFQIPARQLPNGDYIIKVSGRTPSGVLEEPSVFEFSVTRK